MSQPDNPFAHIRTWLFDMDSTLYHPDNGFKEALQAVEVPAIAQQLAMTEDEVLVLMADYHHRFGIPYTGLYRQHPDFDMDWFVEQVANISCDLLQPCQQTAELLRQLPGKKVVWTHSPRGYAQKVLKKLGFDGIFDDIITIQDFEFTGKIEPENYDRVLSRYDAHPEQAVLVEDTPKYLKIAKAHGLTTVHVHTPQDHADYVDHYFPELVDFLTAAVK